METRIIKVRKPSEVADAAREGARAVEAGLLVGFATETVYGIAAVATHAGAMERLRELKSRPKRPFSVHIGRKADVDRYVADVPREARLIIAKGWPGPVTLLLPVGGALHDRRFQKAGLYNILCSEDAIGLRCPEDPVAEAMLSAVEHPVVAPSANLAGEPPPRNAEDVMRSLSGKIDLLIDSGPTRYGKDSTIVSFGPPRNGTSHWKLIRKGVLDERMIRRLIKRKILFICSGNTCRSPMAAGIARKLLADKLGCEASELRRHGVEVVSAGVFAGGGGRATPEAIAAAREHGADISRHRSRSAGSELINDADVVFCMTDAHVMQARRLAGRGIDRIHRLDPKGDIPDPVGGGPEVYAAAAERIERVLKQLVNEEAL